MLRLDTHSATERQAGWQLQPATPRAGRRQAAAAAAAQISAGWHADGWACSTDTIPTDGRLRYRRSMPPSPLPWLPFLAFLSPPPRPEQPPPMGDRLARIRSADALARASRVQLPRSHSSQLAPPPAADCTSTADCTATAPDRTSTAPARPTPRRAARPRPAPRRSPPFDAPPSAPPPPQPARADDPRLPAAADMYPASAHQMDLNFLMTQVVELSTLLQENRAQTEALVQRADDLRVRAPPPPPPRRRR